MNIGDQVTVPDGRTGTLIRLENGVATVLFTMQPPHTITAAFNATDVTDVSRN